MATEQSTQASLHHEGVAMLLSEASGARAVEQFPIALPGLSGAERAVLLRQEQIDQLAHDLLNPLSVLKALSQSIPGGSTVVARSSSDAWQRTCMPPMTR
ncbi:MAG: hypothetical protein EPO30_10725 [Lysobacteraceae bacterium]|nr:MAG: hypothetical protein EPO30_10725 [Xanthomonadaceae bacterium]